MNKLLALLLLIITIAYFASCKPATSSNEKTLVEQIADFDKTLHSIKKERNELAKASRKMEKEEKRLRKSVSQALESISPGEREQIEAGMESGSFPIEKECDPAVVTVASRFEELLLIHSNNLRLREQLRKYDYQIERAMSERYKLKQRLEMRDVLSKEDDKNDADSGLTALASMSDEAIREETDRARLDPTEKTPTIGDRGRVLEEITTLKANSRKRILEKVYKTGLLLGAITLLLLLVVGGIMDSFDVKLEKLVLALLILCATSFLGFVVSFYMREQMNVEMNQESGTVEEIAPNDIVQSSSREENSSDKDDAYEEDGIVSAAPVEEEQDINQVFIKNVNKKMIPQVSVSDVNASKQVERSDKQLEKAEVKKITVDKSGNNSSNKSEDSSDKAEVSSVIEEF